MALERSIFLLIILIGLYQALSLLPSHLSESPARITEPIPYPTHFNHEDGGSKIGISIQKIVN
jgi:hypothetical protein